MEEKKTRQYNVVVVCNDKLTAINIVNKGFNAGFAGNLRRGDDPRLGPLDTYTVSIYGRGTIDDIDRVRQYIRGFGAGVCSSISEYVY